MVALVALVNSSSDELSPFIIIDVDHSRFARVGERARGQGCKCVLQGWPRRDPLMRKPAFLEGDVSAKHIFTSRRTADRLHNTHQANGR